jgi:hypothetical protein
MFAGEAGIQNRGNAGIQAAAKRLRHFSKETP